VHRPDTAVQRRNAPLTPTCGDSMTAEPTSPITLAAVPAGGKPATAPMRAASERTSSRLPGMCLLLVGLVTALPWAIGRDPLLDARIRSFFARQRPPRPPREQHLFANDPALGPLPVGAAFRARRSDSRRREPDCLVMYLGECQSCISTDVGRWQRQAEIRGLDTVALFRANRHEAVEFARNLGLRDTNVIADPQGKLVAKLNGFFSPRAYLVSSKAELRWLQKDTAPYGYDPFTDSTLLRLTAKAMP
jgi:hypothetical protein